MNTENLILAATLAVTLIGTTATLYARLVKIETIQKSHGRGLRRIFRQTKKLPTYQTRLAALEKRVQALTAPTIANGRASHS
jgi:hypothetical protein